MRYDDKTIKSSLKKVLNEKRYEHTIGVADTAASLAFAYQIDFEAAYIAGLLHDCAKNYDGEKTLKLCKKYKVKLSSFEEKNPSLIHAKLGAVLAKEKYGIEEEEILSAISYHTTGKPGMTRLEQIIFCADFIEPNRKMLTCLPVIRETIFQDIDKATYLILKQTLVHLHNHDMCIDVMTEQAFEYYEKLQKESNSFIE